jgi:DNA-binding FadR family transcriptional regulator
VATATTPTTIERALTLDILRGRYAPGSRLPSVRELAERWEVNPATIQRVVARLETRGLIEARQGSGLKVNDAARSGDVALTPYWLEASLDDPERATAILAELLEIRRLVAARLLVRHREAILARREVLERAAARLVEAAGEGLDALRDADLELARELLGATGNVVALGVLNTMGRVLVEQPLVAEAMYAQPIENAASVGEVLMVLATGPDDAERRLERAIEEVDRRTLARFAERVRARRAK